MTNSNSTPVGYKLPLQRGVNGFFAQNFTTLEQASTNITNLILTIRNERRLNVNFGSNLYKTLFEQIADVGVLRESLINDVTSAINLYFPYVDIVTMNVDVPTNEDSKVYIDIKFMLKNSTTDKFGVSETSDVNIAIDLNL